jgi:hypothetical protein
MATEAHSSGHFTKGLAKLIVSDYRNRTHGNRLRLWPLVAFRPCYLQHQASCNITDLTIIFLESPKKLKIPLAYNELPKVPVIIWSLDYIKNPRVKNPEESGRLNLLNHPLKKLPEGLISYTSTRGSRRGAMCNIGWMLKLN